MQARQNTRQCLLQWSRPSLGDPGLLWFHTQCCHQLRRLESNLSILHGDSTPEATGLLRRLFPKTAAAGGHIDRYPPRIFLCAYMLLSHPETLLNGASEWEGRYGPTFCMRVGLCKQSPTAIGADGAGAETIVINRGPEAVHQP